MPIPLDPAHPNPDTPVGHDPGQYLNENYQIVTQLFDVDGNQAFRKKFFDCKNDDDVRWLLTQYKITIAYNVRIMLVDIENARTWQDPSKPPIDATKDLFYVYIMPPVPRRTMHGESEPSKGYKDMQAWEEAWHHAICDGYGM